MFFAAVRWDAAVTLLAQSVDFGISAQLSLSEVNRTSRGYAGIDAVDRSQRTASDSLRLLACTQRCKGMKARSAATSIPRPSASASLAAILA